MSSEKEEREETGISHISLKEEDAEGHDALKGSTTPKSSSGWDGKLRIEKRAELVNPEALSDPEYSYDEQVLQGETIEADEGTFPSFPLFSRHLLTPILSYRPTR